VAPERLVIPSVISAKKRPINKSVSNFPPLRLVSPFEDLLPVFLHISKQLGLLVGVEDGGDVGVLPGRCARSLVGSVAVLGDRTKGKRSQLEFRRVRMRGLERVRVREREREMESTHIGPQSVDGPSVLRSGRLGSSVPKPVEGRKRKTTVSFLVSERPVVLQDSEDDRIGLTQ